MTYTVGATGWWQAVAAGIVLVFTLVAVFALQRPYRRGGLLTGRDRRISTSRTIVYLWTVVVAWMVATEILVALFGDAKINNAAATFGPWMTHVFDDASNWELYLVFLGGPYAAAILAGIVVTNRVQNGTLQKTEATGGANPLDVFRDDEGAVDPVDFQYVLFNLLVAVGVVLAFSANVEDGLPQVAQFLAILTGGSALTYTINKGVTSNAPMLTSVQPQSARVGDRVIAYGANLTVITNPSDADRPAVTVAGVSATVDATTRDSVVFFVPAPASGTSWRPGDRQVVRVTTAAGLTAELANQIAIVADQPVLVRLEPATLVVAGAQDFPKLKLRLTGQFLETPGTAVDSPGAAKIEITDTGGVIVATVDGTLRADHVEFALPETLTPPAAGQVTTLKINVARGSARGVALPLTVTTIAPPELAELNVDEVEADAEADLSAVRLTATGTGLQPPQGEDGGAGVVAASEALPVQVRLTDAQGNTQLLSAELEGEAVVGFTLPDRRAPAPGATEEWTVALVRGVGVSVATRPLKLRARPDPVITRLDPADVTGGPAEAPVKVEGTDLGLEPAPDRLLRVPTKLTVELEFADETTGQGRITGDTTPTALTFTLPSDLKAPAAEEAVQVKVVRGGRVSAPGSLTLKP